jgi:hypothetical protein
MMIRPEKFLNFRKNYDNQWGKIFYMFAKTFICPEKFFVCPKNFWVLPPPSPRFFWKKINWRLKSGETVKTCILVKFSTQFLTECRVCEKLYNGMYRMVTLQRHVPHVYQLFNLIELNDQQHSN